MKTQIKSAKKGGFSASGLRNLQNAYRALARAVCRQPWLAQGSINRVPAKTPLAHDTHTWTRKVRAKTVTVALSRQQADAFRQAIMANRRVEAAFNQLRQVSQAALLADLPGVTKRRSDAPEKAETKIVPKGS